MTPSPPPAARLTAWFMRRTTPLAAFRRMGAFGAALATDVGVVRKENQDRVALVRGTDRLGEPFILAVLADGIGGMKQGAESASVAVSSLIEGVVDEARIFPDPQDWLRRGISRANRAVHSVYGGEGGSTLVATLLTKRHPPLWLSVGDSRVHHAKDAALVQLSRDDTLEGQLGRAIDGSRRSELLQFVGIGPSLEPHIEVVPTGSSGTMVLTSDGVHFVDATFLAKVIHFAPDLGQCVRRLVDMARALGGPDNASVVALKLNALDGEVDAAPLFDSTYEVWDPYGELQVILDRGPRRLPLSVGVSPQPPVLRMPPPAAEPAEQSPADPAKTKGSSVKGTRGTAGKSKTTRKPKTSTKGKSGSKSAQAGGAEAPDKQPELFIEFPNKAES